MLLSDTFSETSITVCGPEDPQGGRQRFIDFEIAILDDMLIEVKKVIVISANIIPNKETC